MKQLIEIRRAAVFRGKALWQVLAQKASSAHSWFEPMARTSPMLWVAVCLAAAISAQRFLDQDKYLGVAGALYAGAALLFALLFGRQSLEVRRVEPEAQVSQARMGFHIPRLTTSAVLIVMALVLGMLAFPRFTDNRFTLDGTVLWGLGLVLLGLAARSHPQTANTGRDMGVVGPQGGEKEGVAASSSGAAVGPESPERPFTMQGVMVSWRYLVLLGIMLLGAFYRLHKLDQIPAEMGPDLPINYNNIHQILQGEFPIFFPAYPGRESLFFYLAAPLASWFGLSHTIIKVAGALVGVATIPVVYLLGTELANREAGLFAAFLLSISQWHIIICRVGYRASMVPLMLGLTWYFVLRALKTGRRWFFALSGFSLGLGLYTYNAFMIVPFLVAFILACFFALDRGKRLLANIGNALYLFLVATYVFIPLGRFAYEQPKAYGFRAATRITNLERPLPGDLLGTLLTTTRKSLLMFNYRGDGVSAANVPFVRELGFVTAVLFVLGVAYLAWRWRHGYNLTVLIALGVMLLPTILSLAFPNEVPNAIRAIGVFPAIVLIPAVALALLRRQASAFSEVQAPAGSVHDVRLAVMVNDAVAWQWRWPGARLWRVALLAVLALSLAVETWSVYPLYFRDYASHLADGNYSISLELARAVDDIAGNGDAYIVIAPNWYDGNAVRAQLRHTSQTWNNELAELRADQPPLVGPPGKFEVIVHPQDSAALDVLRQVFPGGMEFKHLKNDGSVSFITFYGER